jgi:hypothetical protein
MRQPPVQLHYYRVLPVQAIAAATAPAGSRERRLPDRLGQAVRPFHVAVVAVLKHRMVAAGSGCDELMQVSAPA